MTKGRASRMAAAGAFFRTIRGTGRAMILRRALLWLAALSWVLALTAAAGRAQQAEPALPPLPGPVLLKLAKDPAAWRRFLGDHPSLPSAAPIAMPARAGLGWTPLASLTGAKLSNPLLLTDGTVLLHVSCTSTWYRLQPDIDGNYQNGTWSLIADMAVEGQPVYAPRFFASAILPDGRVMVEGGEYNNCFKVATPPAVDTNLGAIYDPTADTWTFVPPPDGWTKIGDASSALLDNGTFLLSNSQTNQLATLDPTDLSWAEVASGKFGINDEENWTLLPDGNILTVDAYVKTKMCGTGSELLLTDSFQWISAGSTIVSLSGCFGHVANFEAPTQILHPGGMVYAFGASASLPRQNDQVPTASYNTATRLWKAGPNMPAVGRINYTMADAPAAILPNGKVLIAASPGVWATPLSFPTPTHFFVFDGKTFTQVGDVANSPGLSSFEMNFLVLPTGEILAVETDFPNVEIFPAVCCALARWAPVITSLPKKAMVPQGTYPVSGEQFSGLTFGASFGDDEQASTNYPLVRITNKTTKHMFYARTFDFTSASVAPGIRSSTEFTLPSDIEIGPSSLVVVANGIASNPVDVTISDITASIALSPSACLHFPQSGGKQTYTATVTHPPPGITLGYAWRLEFGGQASGNEKLTVPDAVWMTTSFGAWFIGPSNSATLTLGALPFPTDGTGDVIQAELLVLTPQGQPMLLNTTGVPDAQVGYTQGALTKCPGSADLADPVGMRRVKPRAEVAAERNVHDPDPQSH